MASASGSAPHYQRTQYAPMQSGRRTRLAAALALAYTAVIAFASLQPFEGWRMPPREILLYLMQPWPRYTTAADLWLNALVYFPLGVFVFVALKRRCGEAFALLLAALYGTLLSLSLESAQMFLPSRIASNVDLLLNAAGTAAGALAGWIFTPPRLPGELLVHLRQRQFVPGGRADLGLVLVAAWLAVQLLPGAPVFAVGDLRERITLEAALPHTPEAYMFIETAVVAASVVALGTLVSLWLARNAGPLRAVVLTIGLALALRTLGATLAHNPNPAPWMTPGAVLGLAFGTSLFATVARAPFRARALLGALAVIAAVAATNLAPENPYLATPSYLLSAELTHLASLSTLLKLTADTWPIAAVFYLLAMALMRERRER
jgi:VanZ family protein